MITLRDLRADRWLGILGAIRRDEDPGRGNLIDALRRQEPHIPGEVQLYLARLLSGDINRRGAPPLSEVQKHNRAWSLADLVDRWAFVFRVRYKKIRERRLVNGESPPMILGQELAAPQQMAFERVSKERGLPAKTIERYYRAAKKLLDPWEIYGEAPWKVARRAAAYEADMKTRGEDIGNVARIRIVNPDKK